MPAKLENDVFISYASEDKEEVVDQLMREFVNLGILAIWLDEVSIGPSESIRVAIERGVSRSRFILPVLTRNYFRKHWTGLEFEAAITLRRGLFPVWHNVTAAQVAKFSPVLAAIKAVDYAAGPAHVADKLSTVLLKDRRTVFAKMEPERKEADAYWKGAYVYICHCLNAIAPETLQRVIDAAASVGYDFLRHYQDELRLSPEDVRTVSTAFPGLSGEDTATAVLEALKEGASETRWVPPNPERAKVLAKIKGKEAS